jgi:hypothetical protein
MSLIYLAPPRYARSALLASHLLALRDSDHGSASAGPVLTQGTNADWQRFYVHDLAPVKLATQ